MTAKEEVFWRWWEEHRVREQVHSLDWCLSFNASLGQRMTSAAQTELALQQFMLRNCKHAMLYSVGNLSDGNKPRWSKHTAGSMQGNMAQRHCAHSNLTERRSVKL